MYFHFQYLFLNEALWDNLYLYESINVLMNFSIILFVYSVVYFAFNHGLLIVLIRFLFHCLTRPGCFITHIIRLLQLCSFNKHLTGTNCALSTSFSNFLYITYLGSSMEVDGVSKRIVSYSVYSPKLSQTKQFRQSSWNKEIGWDNSTPFICI